MTYSVELWSSNKDQGKDNCITGTDHPDHPSALASLASLTTNHSFRYWRYACIEGPSGRTDVKINQAAPTVDEPEDNSEFARMQGMAFGASAYNEANGQGDEPPEASPGYGMR